MTPEDYQDISTYLARLYDVSPYQRHNIQHPVVRYLPNDNQRHDIDSVLGHLTPDIRTVDTFSFYNYAHLHSLQNSGRNLFNGITYSLKRLRQNPLRIDATLGKYFDMIATCGALEAELFDVFSSKLIRLPMRSQYHREMDTQQVLSQGKGRSATIGGVVLVVFNDEGTYKAIVSQRTGAHATRPNALHLLPAFIFQPADEAHATADWTFKYHIYREYLEELVGMEEGDPDMMAHPALLDLKALEAQGDAEIQLTGVSVNLITLRPEISALLLIHDATWWQNMKHGTKGYQLNTPETLNELMLLPIASDDLAQSKLPENYHLNIVPQAIPALWDGIDAARIAISERSDI